MASLEQIKKGLCYLPKDSEQVVDADEEVFILYTDLQVQDHQSPTSAMASFRGLGHVDSHQDILTVKYLLTNPVANLSAASESASFSELPLPARSKPSRRTRKKRIASAPDVIELEIQIIQDKTALHSRKGDTGSVVWKASVDLAFSILQHEHFPSALHPFLDLTELKNAHVLELGSGTGILCVALSPFVRNYTCTDLPELLPLIHKNIVLNFPKWPQDSNISLTPLDWVELQNTNNRSRGFNFNPVDLILIVDCIYHPSLIPPLLATIDYIAIPNVTTVLVVVELRAEDVIRDFLSCWLNVPAWEIWRIGKGGDAIMKRPYAMWVGMKHTGP
ncbi:MAG: putative methyltransferase-domain-containing protein [Lentinula lateritia]|uniref:Methyltransferase-domain-containing protein n=1 Tax=Lentinula lateritia TaxID=40482 RepID=A0ABQ8VES2_9AGAR|nr:MAG: putative methyltransferase-domain-containing protein [Lentinula lateritia]KAJ4486915.1 putative methyltransferase-domain-containing protein [Lentinula lateritia]